MSEKSVPNVTFHIARLDALRACAVLTVLIFHLKPELLPGGYVGVDMFFSLSGFLMTALYLRARAEGKPFTVLNFVKRRFWRIFPPLVITVLATLLGASLLFSPGHLDTTGKSAIASVVSLSNVLFYSEAGYFDTDAVFKPLLHTWSLGVEEQFYALFAVALLLSRRVSLGLILTLLAGFSLAAWAWVILANVGWPLPNVHDEPFAALFFLPQYRAYQFALGGLAAYLLFRPALHRRGADWAGLVLLGLGFWIASDKTAAHIAAPLVSVGMILVMVRAPVLDAVGSHAAVRFVAKISYQLYMVHWPVIVLWQYVTLRPLSMAEAVICAALSFGLAMALYAVTNPLRNKGTWGVPVIGVSSVLALTFGAVFAKFDGAPWRIPTERLYPDGDTLRAAESALCHGTNVLGGVELGTAPGQPLVTCTREASADKTLYVWGDSHARHLFAGLTSSYPDTNVRVMYYTTCRAQKGIAQYRPRNQGNPKLAEGCRDRNQRALKMLEGAAPATVILHNYFGPNERLSEDWIEATETLIDRIEDHGHRVALIGGVIQPGIAANDCLSVPSTISQTYLTKRCNGDASVTERARQRNAELATLFPKNFVDVSTYFCPEGGDCRMKDKDDLLFRDAHHLTVEGSRKMIGAVKHRLSAVLGL